MLELGKAGTRRDGRRGSGPCSSDGEVVAHAAGLELAESATAAVGGRAWVFDPAGARDSPAAGRRSRRTPPGCGRGRRRGGRAPGRSTWRGRRWRWRTPRRGRAPTATCRRAGRWPRAARPEDGHRARRSTAEIGAAAAPPGVPALAGAGPPAPQRRGGRLMAGRGRIRAADIALVRERSKIDEIVGEHLQLKRAGGGSLKGLCPFHDEKSPSFQVTPSRGLYHCLAGETGVLTEDGDHPDPGAGRQDGPRAQRRRRLGRGAVQVVRRPAAHEADADPQRADEGAHATDEHRWFVPSGSCVRTGARS